MMRQDVYAYSIINDNHAVSQESWVVSIVRKQPNVNKKINEEHAFLIVEGKNNRGQVILRRYDLFIDSDSEDHDALIVIKEKTVNAADARQELIDHFMKRDDWYAITWNISPQQATQLHQAVERDRANPPKYQISGNEATGPSLFGSASNSPAGHNCFTWAREKLLGLKDKRIHIPIHFKDKLWARTSHYFGEKKGSCCIL